MDCNTHKRKFLQAGVVFYQLSQSSPSSCKRPAQKCMLCLLVPSRVSCVEKFLPVLDCMSLTRLKIGQLLCRVSLTWVHLVFCRAWSQALRLWQKRPRSRAVSLCPAGGHAAICPIAGDVHVGHSEVCLLGLPTAE